MHSRQQTVAERSLVRADSRQLAVLQPGRCSCTVERCLWQDSAASWTPRGRQRAALGQQPVCPLLPRLWQHAPACVHDYTQGPRCLHRQRKHGPQEGSTLDCLPAADGCGQRPSKWPRLAGANSPSQLGLCHTNFSFSRQAASHQIECQLPCLTYNARLLCKDCLHNILQSFAVVKTFQGT